MADFNVLKNQKINSLTLHYIVKMPLHGRNISDEEKKPMCSHNLELLVGPCGSKVHNCASIGCQSSLENKHLMTVYIVLTSHINKSRVQGVDILAKMVQI